MTTISYPTFIRRPNEYVSGIWGWLTTVDHKKIGTMYGVTAFLWFLVGSGCCPAALVIFSGF